MQKEKGNYRFINVYMPNTRGTRLEAFKQLSEVLCTNKNYIGGDFNTDMDDKRCK